MIKFIVNLEIIFRIMSFIYKIERSCYGNSLKLNCNDCVFVFLKIWFFMFDY